jgi:cytochrome c-type biogenesis protein CcmH
MKMKRKKGNFSILFLLFFISVLWVSPAVSVTVGEITQELTCTCGCNMLVSACEGAMECSAANGIKAQVMEKLNRGQSKEEIIGYFVNRFGEKILSAPTKKGFNLTAWILPFFAIVSGGGVFSLSYREVEFSISPSRVGTQRARSAKMGGIALVEERRRASIWRGSRRN